MYMQVKVYWKLVHLVLSHSLFSLQTNWLYFVHMPTYFFISESIATIYMNILHMWGQKKYLVKIHFNLGQAENLYMYIDFYAPPDNVSLA